MCQKLLFEATTSRSPNVWRARSPRSPTTLTSPCLVEPLVLVDFDLLEQVDEDGDLAEPD